MTVTCRYCGASSTEVGIGDDGLCVDSYKCEERYEQQAEKREEP